MEIFVTSVSVLVLIYQLVKTIVSHFQDESRLDEIKMQIMAVLLADCVVVLLAAMTDGHGMMESIFFISLAIFGVFPLTLSFIPKRFSKRILSVVVTVKYLYIAYRICTMFALLPLFPMSSYVAGVVLLPLVISMLYMGFLIARISDVRFVMRTGSVWNTVCIMVDVIYLMIMSSSSVLFFLLYVYSDVRPVILSSLFVLIFIAILTAMAQRVATSSLFVIWFSHERRIVESMKLTYAEMSMESPGVDVLYKNIYDRVLEHFEKNRPYLNSELTINDVVNVLYTNKLYISKAICAYTGRNFCQFVNYYRITYAIELFRKNPSQKVVDLAGHSGFNSAVSFSMAFRLFMGEKPSDWFRRERARLSKRTK